MHGVPVAKAKKPLKAKKPVEANPKVRLPNTDRKQ